MELLLGRGLDEGSQLASKSMLSLLVECWEPWWANTRGTEWQTKESLTKMEHRMRNAEVKCAAFYNETWIVFSNTERIDWEDYGQKPELVRPLTTSRPDEHERTIEGRDSILGDGFYPSGSVPVGEGSGNFVTRSCWLGRGEGSMHIK